MCSVFIAQCTLHNLVFIVIGLFHILTDVSQVQSFMVPTVCRRMVNGKMQSILIFLVNNTAKHNFFRGKGVKGNVSVSLSDPP